MSNFISFHTMKQKKDSQRHCVTIMGVGSRYRLLCLTSSLVFLFTIVFPFSVNAFTPSSSTLKGTTRSIISHSNLYLLPSYNYGQTKTKQQQYHYHNKNNNNNNNNNINKLKMVPNNEMMMFSDSLSSSLTTIAVEVFDGSTISDPKVVSNVFWTNLQSNVQLLLINQALAAILFVILTTILAPQIRQLGEYVTTKLPSILLQEGMKKTDTFRKATSISREPPNFTTLLVCIVIDTIGTSSEVIPIIGEFTDFVYAPIAALALRSLYGSNVIFALEFLEEILPFTDVLPLATICWVVDTFFVDSDLAKLLQIGNYRSGLIESSNDDGAIDVKVQTKRKDNTDV